MDRKHSTGMRLRQTRDPRKRDSFWLVRAVLAWLASATLTGILNEVTGNTGTVMLAASVLLCAVYGILLKRKQESLFYMGTLILVLTVMLLGRRQVLEGFRLFWNQAGIAMVRGTGWVIPEWELQLGAEQKGLCIFLFSGLSACLLCLVSCLLISHLPVLMALLLPTALMGGMALFGGEGQSVGLIPALAVAVLILLYGGWRKNGSAAAVVVNCGFCAMAAVLLIACACVPGVQEWTAQIHERVHQTVHEKKYETQYTTLPEGDFSDYRKSDREAEHALAVTMEEPQQLYLRGFTGAEFAEDRWKPLDKEALAKNRQLLYWLNLNAFDQNAQFEAAAAEVQLPQSTVTVQNISACSFYRYVPFSVEKGAWAQPENLNTDGIYAEGERSYVYSVLPAGGEELMQVLNSLQTSEDPAVLRYRKAESGYRKFIYHHYLQVSEEVKDLLKEKWDTVAGRYGTVDALTPRQAQECVLRFLSQCFPGEGTPADMELPLEQAEGTAFQYATVAAMTLRYFGIPSRYAEGYVISAEMAAKAKSGETLHVDSSCAGAWVEIYQDGLGWIPMDLLPGMGEMLEHRNSDDPGSGEGASGRDSGEKEEDEEPEEEPSPESEPTGGTVVTLLLKTAAAGMLVLLVAVLGLFLILWIRRKILLGQKEKKFQSDDCRDAVAWLYADIALLLSKLGFDRGNGSMKQLQRPLEERFGAEFAEQFACVSDLNDRAMFSSRPMEEEHRNAVRKFRSRILETVNLEEKWYKRMWLKWVLCLY